MIDFLSIPTILILMQISIETDLGNFRRTAWTGGDIPDKLFEKTVVGRQLFEFFLREQIDDCGGVEGTLKWLFADQTLEEKMSIFRNRALLDAWRTFQNPA
jgi:hypothetical protein